MQKKLHFTKAAAKLFISQPPLSRQIKELEEELSVKLFVRNNKQVALTNAGKYFKTEVDSLFARLEESKDVVRKIHEGVSGEFKVGYISSVYQSQLAEILKLMHEKFPYMKTSLFEVPTLAQIKALEHGDLDVGILRAPVLSEKLKVESLFFDPFVVVTPSRTHKIDDQYELTDFLRKSPFIFFNKDYAPQYNQKLIEICQRMGFSPDITHEANNVHSILQLVEAGLGVSILPLSLKKQYAQLKVSFIELSDIPINTEVVLAYKESNKNEVLNWFIKHYMRLKIDEFRS
ncbi:LysR family transcriptional regulator [Pedobacter terrae]|uniref:LysR family transcriptional regulator n=1 Tax=Pedobacter terrae TaxID=405671 RepID=UPI002FFB0BFD